MADVSIGTELPPIVREAILAREELRVRMADWWRLVAPVVKESTARWKAALGDRQAITRCLDEPGAAAQLAGVLPDLRGAQTALWSVLDRMTPEERHTYSSETVRIDTSRRLLADAEWERTHPHARR